MDDCKLKAHTSSNMLSLFCDALVLIVAYVISGAAAGCQLPVARP
jgi:hypothetical protein